MTGVWLALLGAQAAMACNEPKIAVSPGQANAGDSVSFTIVNTEEGAGYTVSVGSLQVASGVDADGGGVGGSFAMPNLGPSPQSVSVSAVVTHQTSDDVHAASPWRSTRQMSYLVAASTPDGGGANAPAATGDPAAAPQGSAQRATVPAQSSVSGAETRPAAGSRPTQRVGRKAGALASRVASGSASAVAAKVFPGSLPAVSRGEAGTRSPAGSRLARSASADLWSGFAGRTARTALGEAGTSRGAPGSAIAVFAGPLALGLATLLTAACIAAARPRRRRAG